MKYGDWFMENSFCGGHVPESQVGATEYGADNPPGFLFGLGLHFLSTKLRGGVVEVYLYSSYAKKTIFSNGWSFSCRFVL
jgi:hypothetical protein